MICAACANGDHGLCGPPWCSCDCNASWDNRDGYCTICCTCGHDIEDCPEALDVVTVLEVLEQE